ncbi:unnamed protein product [Pleuronectes platessa]|uniref:Uncharacterized protein n=1 Tax=Pleuronectes platessa TaxID=8262 RepID=A0A9N7YSZ5_PLEPL|nr:unnamed protein product [Pleuronectes platessa]
METEGRTWTDREDKAEAAASFLRAAGDEDTEQIEFVEVEEDDTEKSPWTHSDGRRPRVETWNITVSPSVVSMWRPQARRTCLLQISTGSVPFFCSVPITLQQLHSPPLSGDTSLNLENGELLKSRETWTR